MHAAPTIRKDVPSNAVSIRKTKKADRLGAKAVPREHARNSTDVTIQIYHMVSMLQSIP